MAAGYSQNVNTFTDYGAEAQDIERRRKMAELLQQQGMQPIEQQTAGGYVVPTSWTQGLAKALQSGLGGYQQGQLREEQKALGQRYTSERSAALANALKAGDGTPSSPYDATEFGGDAGMNPATAPDRMATYRALAASQFPDLQTMGMAELLKKPENPFAKIDPKDYTADSIRLFAATQNPAVLVPVRKKDIVNLGGTSQVVDTYSATPGESFAHTMTPDTTARVGIEAANKPFLPDGRPNTAYQTYELGKANAGATRVQTNVNAFTPASEEAQRDFIKSTRATYDTLKQVPVALKSIETAKALVPAAAGFMGPGGESLLNAAKFLNNRIGTSINTEGVKSAEELRTRIFFNIMDNLKKMDAQPSQQQQQIMQEALGKLGTDPNALPAVLDAFGDVMKGKVALHNAEVQSAIQRGVKFPYDPVVNIDTQPVRETAPPASTAQSLPAGIPTGSKKIGSTPDGRPVYEAPNGKRYVP